MLFTWATIGGYEVSSAGDWRFSAMYARMPGDDRTIEEVYQTSVKGYPTRKQGKGKPPLNNVDLWEEYLGLWRIWAGYNEEILMELATTVRQQYNGVLTDRWAKTEVNQARALAVILNESPHLCGIAPVDLSIFNR